MQAATSIAGSTSAQAGVPVGTLANGTWQVAATPQTGLVISTLPAAIGSGVSVRACLPASGHQRRDLTHVRGGCLW